MSSDTKLSGFPDLSEEPSSLCKRLSSISCERDVFLLIHKNTFCVLRFPRSITDWIGFGLGWFGKLNTWYFSKRLLSEFSDWLLFNCRTQLIIPSWSNRDRVSMRSLVVVEVTCMVFHTMTSPVFNLSTFGMQISWKCPLKNNCIRSCLIEC